MSATHFATTSISQQQRQSVEKMLNLLICPIFKMALDREKIEPAPVHMFKDPVTTPGGYTYEREWLEAYLKSHNNETPTGERLSNIQNQLVVNYAIKGIVDS